MQLTGGEHEKKLSGELQETLDLSTAYEPYLQSHLPALLRYLLMAHTKGGDIIVFDL
jgi:hypothetical protein